MKFFLVLLLPAMVAAAALDPSPTSAAAAAPPPLVLGGYRPITNLSDPYISEIGRWAVIEYNREHPNPSSPYVFKKVVSGKSQVVAGTNYKLILSVKNGGLILNHEAIVYDKPWASHRELKSFILVKPN